MFVSSEILMLKDVRMRIMAFVIEKVLPMLADPKAVVIRQGVCETVYLITQRCVSLFCFLFMHLRMGLDVVPFIVFLILPTLARMSDFDSSVRQVASLSFSMMIRLMPLEVDNSTLPFSESLMAQRAHSMFWAVWLLFIESQTRNFWHSSSTHRI